MYDRASKSRGSEDLMVHLFMAHVRSGDFKSQQQTAMRLIKHFKLNGRYVYWNVMSFVLMV